MGVAYAHHVVAAKVHVHLAATVANPPEPEYGHLCVHDAHFRGADLAVDPLVVQQSHQPLEPLDGAYPVPLLSYCLVLPDAGVDHRGRRAAGEQAEIRVAHVAAETVHRGPDQVQAAAGRPALDQRRQPAPHGHLRFVNALGLAVVQVRVPDFRRQLKRVTRMMMIVIIIVI